MPQHPWLTMLLGGGLALSALPLALLVALQNDAGAAGWGIAVAFLALGLVGLALVVVGRRRSRAL